MKETFDVFLSGGGLDSAAYMTLEQSNLDAVLVVDYGQIMFKQEAQATLAIAAALPYPQELIKGGSISPHILGRFNTNSLLLGLGDDPAVVGRNYFLANAAIEAYLPVATEQNKQLAIHFGFCSEVMVYSDGSRNFINRLLETWGMAFGYLEPRGRQRVVPMARYSEVPKAEFIQRTSRLKGGKEALIASWTCWSPTAKGDECGTCRHCVKKADLFKQLGIA